MTWFKRKPAPRPPAPPPLPELTVPSNPALDAVRAQLAQTVEDAFRKIEATSERLRAYLDERDKKEGRTT